MDPPSFGFDVLQFIKIAVDVRHQYKNAPKEVAAIKDEYVSLKLG